MQRVSITIFFLLTLASNVLFTPLLSAATPQKIKAIHSNEDIPSRFQAQWIVDEGTRKKIYQVYGGKRIDFDPRGYPITHGLSPMQIKRWERLYNLCMSDGCYYCDADEGSCEQGTCGPHNGSCLPYMGTDGQPICGRECADYAFKSILICNDLS